MFCIFHSRACWYFLAILGKPTDNLKAYREDIADLDFVFTGI